MKFRALLFDKDKKLIAKMDFVQDIIPAAVLYDTGNIMKEEQSVFLPNLATLKREEARNEKFDVCVCEYHQCQTVDILDAVRIYDVD